MSTPTEFEVDRIRIKFPRSYKALVQLYPGAWDAILKVVEEAMDSGRTASVIAGKLSILRGLDRSTRRWVVLCLAADRREIVIRRQRSFLTQLHDRSLEEILAELQSLEAQYTTGGVRTPPHDDLPRGFVFVSHHKNSAGTLAHDVATSLESLRHKCWVAPRDVRDGLDWNDEVYSAAQRCSAMVLLLNDSARKSRIVKGEVHIAVGRDIPVFVVRLDDCDPAALNVGLVTYHHIECQPMLEVSSLTRRLSKGLIEAGTNVVAA